MNGPDSPDTLPRPGFSLRRFVVRRLRFLAVAMPLACAMLLLPFDNYVFELLRHFRLWNAVIGIALAVLLLLFRDWKFAVIALLAGVWQGWPVWDYSRAQPPNPPASSFLSLKAWRGQGSFTLLSCNLLYECRDPERMIASLRNANPDVMLFLEFTPEWQRKFAATLWNDYPHRVEEPLPGYSGICLASKLPLESAESLEVAGGVPLLRAVVLVADERITLLGVHPPPPIRPELYKTWRASFDEWPALVLEPRENHYLVAGDLNTTPFTRTFARLCEETGLRDSAVGYGLTNTWHLAGPLGLPLDHVLVSYQLLVTERTIGPDTGSDHRWVMVRLVPGA